MKPGNKVKTGTILQWDCLPLRSEVVAAGVPDPLLDHWNQAYKYASSRKYCITVEIENIACQVSGALQ